MREGKGWEGVSLSGRCPAAVTRCKPPIKAGLNPLALFPGGSVMEGALLSKAPPDGSRNSLMRPKPLLSILGEELRGGGSAWDVCLFVGAGDPGHRAGSSFP